MLQTVFITALTVLVGRFILEYFIDGIYNDSFANGFLRILEAFHVSEETATSLYWQWIGNNKVFFMILGFLLLFSLFFYVALSKMTRYLEQVEDGIENIISASDQPIRLITELKPIEDRLNEIKETLRSQEEEAEKLEQRKNDVLLFLAHDLKTPLTSVVAYLSMLDSHPEMPAEERAKYTQISLEKANRLGDLLKEFFESIKLNLQDIELDKVDIDLTMMLEQIADELYGVLQEKMLTCKVEAEEEILIEGDPDKLARVFDNILRNAIAYCREKSVLLIQAAKEENQVRICFENEGDTIPEESLKRIFDKFYRADASRSSSTGGAGLGLAIAKEIVELHNAGSSYTAKRPEELWNSFERLLNICEEEQTDLLLIAGDLFHRQPLLRELKELDYLFSRLTHTQVVLIAGNHDYLKSTSYYRNYKWQGPVHMFLSQKPACMEFKELGVRIYGLSYEEREITEPLYEKILPEKRGIASILLAHGGDEKHIPFRKNELLKLGYDYIALGHIHLPAELAKDRMYYAGSLEPTDKNDTGKHGYIKGEIKNGRTRTEFIPFASREYVHMEVEAGREMTGREMKEKIALAIRERGIQNIYKIILRGFRDPDMIYDTDRMDSYGNIVEILDETKPAYDYEKLKKQNAGNLLGWYIESFAEAKDDSVEAIALAEGVQAMLEAKGSKL